MTTFKHGELYKIHSSMLDGQRKKAVRQIDDYGLYDFFDDYRSFLDEIYVEDSAILQYLTDAVVTYHRIKNR